MSVSREVRNALQAYTDYLTALQNGPLTETYPELNAAHLAHRAALVERYGAARANRMYTRCRRSIGVVLWSAGSLTFRRL